MALPPNPDGGDLGGGGAGSYRVLGQRPSILVRAGNTVVDAMTITVLDRVYGVTFAFTLPRTEWAGEGTAVAAADYASYVQTIGAHEHVVGLSYAEDVNAAGNLVDVLIVTVGTDDGESTADVSIPMARTMTPGAFAQIDAAYATLTATAAL